MVKCIICEQRPEREDGLCAHCASKLHAERKAKANGKPRYYLTYQGDVVGLFTNGNGTLKARLLKRSADKLPKRNTIDLNRYCYGYSRQQIKGFKACVLQLANA